VGWGLRGGTTRDSNEMVVGGVEDTHGGETVEYCQDDKHVASAIIV
jgi:hypothetical protein